MTNEVTNEVTSEAKRITMSTTIKQQLVSSETNSDNIVRISPPCVLYRDSMMEPEEKRSMERYFVSLQSRVMVHGGDLVVPRYASLPYYKELETDLAHKGAKLINSFRDHRYVADLQNYVTDLGSDTFRTWSWNQILEVPENIPLVVKGETNSRKDKWSTHMFAKNKQEAVQVYNRLQDDSLITSQEIYLREYVPLETLCHGIGGQPITLEYRFFVCHGEILSGGFYWSSHVDELKDLGVLSLSATSVVPQDWLQEMINRVKDHIPFFVIDVAKTAAGTWMVVELNDGTMSGLSENSPETLYKNLKHVLWDRHLNK